MMGEARARPLLSNVGLDGLVYPRSPIDTLFFSQFINLLIESFGRT